MLRWGMDIIEKLLEAANVYFSQKKWSIGYVTWCRPNHGSAHSPTGQAHGSIGPYAQRALDLSVPKTCTRSPKWHALPRMWAQDFLGNEREVGPSAGIGYVIRNPTPDGYGSCQYWYLLPHTSFLIHNILIGKHVLWSYRERGRSGG